MNKLKNLKSFIEENKDEIIKKLNIANKLEIVDIEDIVEDKEYDEVEAISVYIIDGETFRDPKTGELFKTETGIVFRFDGKGGTFRGKSLIINEIKLKYTFFNI
jgi:hypothetical protein